MNQDTKLEIIVALIYSAQFGSLLAVLVFMMITKHNANDVLLALGIGITIIIIGNLIYRKLTTEKPNLREDKQ